MTPRRDDRHANADSARRRQEMKRLVEIYALRVRRLSEVVAGIGGHITTGRGVDEAVLEAKQLHDLCVEAGRDFFVAVESQQETSPFAARDNTPPAVQANSPGE